MFLNSIFIFKTKEFYIHKKNQKIFFYDLPHLLSLFKVFLTNIGTLTFVNFNFFLEILDIPSVIKLKHNQKTTYQ